MVSRLSKYDNTALIIIVISLIIRAFFAGATELGNDEVYYWLYAKYPALSYFDHPPGLSMAIRFFTFDLSFDSEFFLRLASLTAVTINGFIVYGIASRVKDKQTGISALIIYYSTFYTSIISGIFIIPDGPLSTLWLLAIHFFIKAFDYDYRSVKGGIWLLSAGLVTGLAISTKYHAVFLWAGAGGYILFRKREFLQSPYLYLSVLLSIAGTLPVIIWNIENDWISFRFHEGRVTPGLSIEPFYFIREITGELIYQNPVVFVILVLSLINLGKLKFNKSQYKSLLLWFSLPLIGVFWFVSLFKPTLPHWTGPGFYPLIIIAAVYLQRFTNKKRKTILVIAPSLVFLLMITALLQINSGIFSGNSEKEIKRLGHKDVTLDMYGWKQIENQMAGYIKKSGDKTHTLIAKKWFNAAHLDYYVCRSNNLKLIALGDATDIHEYGRINKIRGLPETGEDAYFIAVSREFTDPIIEYSTIFESIEPVDTFIVERAGQPVEYAVLFIMKNYQPKQ